MNNSKLFRLAATIAVIFTTLSCNLLNSKPDPISVNNFIEGIWVPSVFSFDFLKESGYRFSEMRLEFKGDNTVSMINIPADWVFPESYSNSEYFSGNGIWTVVEPAILNLDNLEINTKVKGSTGREVVIQFGEILDNLYFNLTKPTGKRSSVTFERCYPHLHITDNMFSPLIQALNNANHEELGFTPIDPKAMVEIAGTINKTSVGLQVYSYTSRFIAFKLEGNKYIWTHEQEIFRGPHIWVAYDGAVNEERVTFQYQKEPINGETVNALTIEYYGNDPRIIENPADIFSSQNISNKDDILPIIEEWKKLDSGRPPFPQYLCP